MAMSGLKRMLVKMAGIEKEMEWVSAERVNIMLTAVFPTLLGLVGVLVQVMGESKLGIIKEKVQNDIFVYVIQILLIVCVLYVLFRIGDRQHFDNSRESRLRDYLINEANMHDKSRESLDIVVHLIKNTVTRFYRLWKILWISLLLYYVGNLMLMIIDAWIINKNDDFALLVVNNVFNNLLNYVSSCAMFFIFIVLNTATISKEEKDIYRYGLTSSFIFVGVFGCLVLFPTLYSLSLVGRSYYCFQMYISFVLSVFSVLSFVFLLGKLNSTYLHVPRLIFYGLYFYAIAQMFQFLLVNNAAINDVHMPCLINSYMDKIIIVYHYITFAGKILLALLIIWIMHASRFLCFIVQHSIEISETEYIKQVFKSYFNDEIV